MEKTVIRFLFFAFPPSFLPPLVTTSTQEH